MNDITKELINSENARAAGVLLHISSLPGEYGIGSFGQAAYDFVDWLKSAGVKYWQVLPLVQTGFGDSPYQSVACNSGNPYFIDLDILAEKGLLTKAELKEATMPKGNVDYGGLYAVRYPVLRKAFSRFNRNNAAFQKFVKEGKFTAYAEYMTLKGRDNRCFAEWDLPYKNNERGAVHAYILTHEDEFLFWQWLQFEFERQWKKLKNYANKKGISIIGDVPLYVAYDSADVWGMPELFKLDEERKMTEVAGVPPDYFSATGQLWGNPLYNWERQKEDGYQWWINRVENSLTTFDVARIDHFRGLDRYYAVPMGRSDAVVGRWCDGPKAELFTKAKERLGEMNIIAEDLGVLDEGGYKLLADTAYPGMKILLFAFEGGDNDYLPKNIGHNSVCYTVTHDNDTAVGYFKRLNADMDALVTKNIREALESRNLTHDLRGYKNKTDALIEMALECDACLAVIPLQDILHLDNSARMNEPATNQKNWKFRLKKLPDAETAKSFCDLVKKYKRK
ncbi:MAG: 4-alpha-glucanotransferase [Clostridia bacterium]|nr:4-alpha-glucanotransferase [Clostridia bacterium]